MPGRCPRCGSPEIGPDGRCLACRFDAATANRYMTKIYAVTGAVAASVLLYGIIGYALVQAGAVKVRPDGGIIVYVFLVVSLAAMASGIAVARKRRAGASPDTLLVNLVTAAALCEVPAVLGFLALLIAGSMMWMALLIGCSLVAFGGIGAEMPAYAQAVTEWVDREEGRQPIP